MLKSLTSITNILFLGGAVVMLILTIISGLLHKLPMSKFYWLKADTRKIPGAYQETAWTFWGPCEAGNYSNCKLFPGAPIEPVSNFNTTEGVPQPFIDNKSTYYYLSRFAFAFCFLGLGFLGIALMIVLVGFWWDKINYGVLLFSTLATIFVAGLCALQTSVTVMARNNFLDAGMDAHVQTKSLAIIWASLAALLLVWFTAVAGLAVTSYRDHMSGSRKVVSSSTANDGSSFTRVPKDEPVAPSTGGGIRFFKIKRNKKDLDNESV